MNRLWLAKWRTRRWLWHRLGRCYFSRCGHQKLTGHDWYCDDCLTFSARLVVESLTDEAE